MPGDDFRTTLKAEDVVPKARPAPAPAIVALGAAWMGLLSLLDAIALPFVPGSRDAVQELRHAKPWAAAEWVLMIGIYGSVVSMFLGIVVLWQMRREDRPLGEALAAQRLQAFVGIVLGILAAAVVYVFVALRGPR